MMSSDIFLLTSFTASDCTGGRMAMQFDTASQIN